MGKVFLLDKDGNPIDVETLSTMLDNIDGKKGLVTKSEMYGRTTDAACRPLPCAQLGDAITSAYYPLRVISHKVGYDGTQWQRWRNNTECTLLDSAARTVTTNSPDQINYNHKGLFIMINVSAISSTPSITARLEMKDSISGLYSAITVWSSPITAVGVYVIALYPHLTDVAGVYHLACDTILHRTWRLRINHGNVNSITYSASCSMVL